VYGEVIIKKGIGRVTDNRMARGSSKDRHCKAAMQDEGLPLCSWYASLPTPSPRYILPFTCLPRRRALTLTSPLSHAYMPFLDVAARIMRKENYLIALINKDILDLHIPFPFLRKSILLTKTIEWGLTYPSSF
jgi:hypothetical protein